MWTEVTGSDLSTAEMEMEMAMALVTVSVSVNVMLFTATLRQHATLSGPPSK